MKIEAANAATIHAVTTLLSAQFEEHRVELTPRELEEAVRVLIVEEGRGAVLLAHDPTPIGVAVLAYTWTLEHGGLVAWLDELFVVPERRGTGVGRALLRRAVGTAKEAGCRAVELEVDAEHLRAQHLYQREGFTNRARRRWVKVLGPA